MILPLISNFFIFSPFLLLKRTKMVVNKNPLCLQFYTKWLVQLSHKLYIGIIHILIYKHMWKKCIYRRQKVYHKRPLTNVGTMRLNKTKTYFSHIFERIIKIITSLLLKNENEKKLWIYLYERKRSVSF